MKTFFLVAALAVIASISRAADPGGWNGVTWGMTEDQVAAVFPQAKRQAFSIFKRPGVDYGISLKMENYDIAGLAFHVEFLEDLDHRLVGVNLVRIRGDKADFEKIEKLMVEKYGAPSYTTLPKGDAWTTDTALMNLNYYELSSGTVVTLFYVQPRPVTSAHL